MMSKGAFDAYQAAFRQFEVAKKTRMYIVVVLIAVSPSTEDHRTCDELMHAIRERLFFCGEDADIGEQYDKVQSVIELGCV